MELYFNIAGMALFLITACLTFTYWANTGLNIRSDNRHIVMAKGVLCSINVVAYALSGYLYYMF